MLCIEVYNLNVCFDVCGGLVELCEFVMLVNWMFDCFECVFVWLLQFLFDFVYDMCMLFVNVISLLQIMLLCVCIVDEYEVLIELNIEECEWLQWMIENMLFFVCIDNVWQYLKIVELDVGSELCCFVLYFQVLVDEVGVCIDVYGEVLVVVDVMLFWCVVSNFVLNVFEYVYVVLMIELVVFV